MESRSVSNIIYKCGLDALQDQGIDTEKLLQSCGLTRYEIEKKQGRISSDAHYRLLTAMSHYKPIMSENPLSESHFFNSLEQAYFLAPELIGLCLNERTLQSALKQFTDYRLAIGNCDDLTIKTGANQTAIEYRNLGPSSMEDHGSLGNIILICNLMKHYAPDIRMQVELAGNNIRYKSLLEHLSNHRCLFNRERNLIIIDNKQLQRTNALFNEGLNRLQVGYIKQLKTNILCSPSFSNTIKEMIHHIYFAKQASGLGDIINIICSELKVSRWTLNRRLKTESVNFSQLLNEVQTQIAIKLLRETSLSIQEISDFLFFSSHSAFSRFLKAQTHLSPIRYRDKHSS